MCFPPEYIGTWGEFLCVCACVLHHMYIKTRQHPSTSFLSMRFLYTSARTLCISAATCPCNADKHVCPFRCVVCVSHMCMCEFARVCMCEFVQVFDSVSRFSRVYSMYQYVQYNNCVYTYSTQYILYSLCAHVTLVYIMYV